MTQADAAVLDRYKASMRRLAATVVVVSAARDGKPHGITATAVTSVSMAPPSLLVCVNRQASFHAHLAGAERFCVNLLSADQTPLADRFAGRATLDERTDRGAWDWSETEVPYIHGAQANIFCKPHSHTDFGSHTIFFGLVEDVAHADGFHPLIYGDGRYLTCAT